MRGRRPQYMIDNNTCPQEHRGPGRAEVRRQEQRPRIPGARTSSCAARARTTPTSADVTLVRPRQAGRHAPTTSSPGSAALRPERAAVTCTRDATAASPTRGFTLIEVMVVIAIVALLTGLGCGGSARCARATCARRATQLSGAMRYLFDRASTTGKIHRLVIDMETGKYWAEVSDDRFYIPREARPSRAAARARGEGGRAGRGDGEEGASRRRRRPSAARLGAAARSFDLSKLEVGDFRPKRARFASFKDLALKPVTAEEGEGPQRLHAARDRAADRPGAPTSTSSRSGRPSRRSSR